MESYKIIWNIRGFCIVMGVPLKKWMVYTGKSHLEMDCFRKPPLRSGLFAGVQLRLSPNFWGCCCHGCIHGYIHGYIHV